MSTFIRINDWIIKIAKVVSIVAFILMLLMSTAQILFRFIFNLPLGWTEELSRFMFVWATMIGISIFTRVRAHSTVDVLSMSIPEKFQKPLQLLVDVLCIVFFAVIIVGGFIMVKVTMNQISPACKIPMGLIYLAVPVSGIIMLSMTIENILKQFLGWKEEMIQ